MNVKNYVDLELEAAQLFLSDRKIKGIAAKNNRKDKTATDIIMKTKWDDHILTEVKVEDNWSYRTGNITFDAISVFQWTTDYRTRGPIMFKDLKPYIQIKTYGTTFLNNYDILLKWIRNLETGEYEFLYYNARLLRKKNFAQYLANKYSLRVNPKKKYGLDDSWESAFWAVPIKDPLLQAAQF